MNKNFIIETELTKNQVAIFYLGQVGFVFKYRGKYILIDGYLSNYVDRNCNTDKVKWVRRYPSPISASELDFIDYVFCTHAHFDHADPYTLSQIAEVNQKAKYIVSSAIADTIINYGLPQRKIIGVKCDEKRNLDDDICFTAIPAAHEELHLTDDGSYLEVGFKFELGKNVIFHGGDGCPYDGLEERILDCDILMLPVNGRDFYRRNICDIIGCFDSREAAIIAKNCRAGLLIPTHFDLYDANSINPAQFVDTLRSVNPHQKFHIFMPGERFIYEK